ncbi:cytochrome c biogenesis protein ResB [Cellulomonas sp. RIT-PI-Y]|uniref:cytochrome c biogenesis protein ResB n=1 Tax=Cellulomonas sp. RIT-PI-Y TaxID=3035297 RepID=UPI0021D8410B|nr:cytochrome c biogenesis protein ResB [Cellulomonas sp. RIT-PI-Y]
MTQSYRPEGLEDAFTEGGGTPPAQVPSIGVVGWLRWMWRQLTSMRVALLLLMLLAVAAVPGTVWPQNAQDPDKVATYLTDHPSLGPFLDRLQVFDVYSSVWFSAIYLLLFVSLVGCILPRSKTHWRAMRGRPPKAPRRFDRFPAQAAGEVGGTPEQVARTAAGLLGAGRRFRVDVKDEGSGVWSVAAERGYLRETGNLVFHLALVGLLVSVAAGQLLHYRGQAIIVEGRAFANTQSDYDTFEAGAAFDPSSLSPFSLRLDSFESRFDPDTLQSRDFTAHVTLTEPGADPESEIIKVNHPLETGGAKVYLQGNGYAPQVTVRNADGDVTFSGAVPFLPQDTVYTSQGVIKVPDVTSGPQIGLQGVLLPTAESIGAGIYRSTDPQPNDPLLALAVWTGDLGLDDGIPQNVYQLDETGLTQVMADDGTALTLYLKPGETVDLPDGLGTITFESLPRFVALDLRHDPSLLCVLVFALLAFAGLAASLFVPRRRIWLRLRDAAPTDSQDEGPGNGRTVVTAAALARGDDVGLQAELDRAMDRLLGRDKTAAQ